MDFFARKERGGGDRVDEGFLSGTPLFKDMDRKDVQDMLACLGSYTKTYEKGAFIFREGERTQSMGMVLSGSVHIETEDFWGNRSIISDIGPGELFGEAYACLKDEPLMVNVQAVSRTKVLFLEMGKVIRICPRSCPCHSRLIDHLLMIMARKNLLLSHRILHTMPKTIRERLLAYLSYLSVRQEGNWVTTPFNRQQMADYLNVDRSALSAEIGRMQKEGLIEVEKNRFRIRGSSPNVGPTSKNA